MRPSSSRDGADCPLTTLWLPLATGGYCWLLLAAAGYSQSLLATTWQSGSSRPYSCWPMAVSRLAAQLCECFNSPRQVLQYSSCCTRVVMYVRTGNDSAYVLQS